MDLRAAWNALWEKKETAAGGMISFAAGTRNAIWTPRDYERLSKESYEKNIIAYRAIRVVATSAASVSWKAYQNNVQLDTHPLQELIDRPNVLAAQSEFFENLTAYYQISGNSYIEAVSPNIATTPPTELWTQRPDRMRVKAGDSNVPSQYIYSVGGKDHIWGVDPISGLSEILHLKTFNPTNDWYGLSPLDAAAMSVDIHNDALTWNKVLVQNDARPPGVLTYAPKDGSNILTDDQRDRIVEELEQKYAGKESAKRPLLLEGGLEWQQLGLTPKDMDFIEAKNTTSTDIAQAFGVPPQMIGVPGSQTFANYEQARLAFWEDTVIPLLYSFRDELNNWLTPMFNESGLNLRCVLDDVPALAERRRQHFDMVTASDHLTVNEKREALGHEPVDGGDVVLVPATMVPLDIAGAPIDEVAEKSAGGWEYKLFSQTGHEPDSEKPQSSSASQPRSKEERSQDLHDLSAIEVVMPLKPTNKQAS